MKTKIILLCCIRNVAGTILIKLIKFMVFGLFLKVLGYESVWPLRTESVSPLLAAA